MAFKNYRPASGIPARGAGNGAPRAALDMDPEKQRERSKKGVAARRVRAEARQRAIEAGRAEFHDPQPSRAQIAALAQSGMADALVRLERLIHESRSDMAVVTAFSALKEAAYGKDSQAIALSVDYATMTDDELRAAIAIDLPAAITEGPGDARGIAAPALAREPD